MECGERKLIQIGSFSDTSRPPRVLEENGKNYWFTDREEMEEEIRSNNFLEHGEHNGNLYGTHLDSIRDIIKQGNIRSTGWLNPVLHFSAMISNNVIVFSMLI